MFVTNIICIKWIFPKDMIMSAGAKKKTKKPNQTVRTVLQTQTQQQEISRSSALLWKGFKKFRNLFYYWLVKQRQVQTHWHCRVSAKKRNKTEPSIYCWDKIRVSVSVFVIPNPILTQIHDGLRQRQDHTHSSLVKNSLAAKNIQNKNDYSLHAPKNNPWL